MTEYPFVTATQGANVHKHSHSHSVLHSTKRSFWCLTIAAVGLSALLVTGCGATAGDEATSTPSAGNAASPSAVATKKAEAIQDLSSLGSPHTPKTATQNGFLVWVPKDWSIVHDDNSMLIMIPDAFQDEWDSLDRTPSVSVYLDPAPTTETPLERYDRSKSAVVLGGGTISDPQDVSWLGIPGLRWIETDVGKFTQDMTRLEGRDGFRAELNYSAEAPSYGEYRSTADSIIASIRRAR